MAIPATRYSLKVVDSNKDYAMVSVFFPGLVTDPTVALVTDFNDKIDALMNGGPIKSELKPTDNTVTGTVGTTAYPIGEDRAVFVCKGNTTGTIHKIELPAPSALAAYGEERNGNRVNLAYTTVAPVVTWINAHALGSNGESLTVQSAIRKTIKRHKRD